MALFQRTANMFNPFQPTSPAGESVIAWARLCGCSLCTIPYAAVVENCCQASIAARSRGDRPAISSGSSGASNQASVTCAPITASGARRPISGAIPQPQTMPPVPDPA
jgi:hypothetical protein